MKPAARLNEVGQSAWLDVIGRKLIHSGELWRMVEEDGVRGVTANPAIFEKAIVESDEYDEQLSELFARGKPQQEIYETVDLPKLLESGFAGGRELVVRATAADGKVKSIRTTVRIDTPQEIAYYQHGGILHFVVRQLLSGSSDD